MAVDEQWGFKQSAQRFSGHHFMRSAASDHSPILDQSHTVGEFSGQIDLVRDNQRSQPTLPRQPADEIEQ